MHKNDYRMFDGFYIPVIPDADYHFDTDNMISRIRRVCAGILSNPAPVSADN